MANLFSKKSAQGITPFALLISIMITFSCNEEPGIAAEKLQYFDVTGFINNEVENLSAENPAVEKTVFLNGKREIKNAPIPDWESELSAFKDADINKKSFLGKYAVDSAITGNSLFMKYRALDKNLRTKEIAVEYEGKSPVKVTAMMATDNALYSSKQELSYEVGKGYWISGKQTVRFLEADSFYVEVKFVNMTLR